MDRKGKQEKSGGMGKQDRCRGDRKRKEKAKGELGIHKEQLERSAQPGEKRGRSNREQQREPYQSCAVSKDEFTTDGMEQGRSRQGVTNKDILEEWKRHAETGTETERRNRGRSSGRRKIFKCKRNTVMGKENE